MSYNLTYFWKAYFRDGSILNQIDSHGIEVNFQEVLNRERDLEKFELMGGNEVSPIDIILDLKTGIFNVNGIVFAPSYIDNTILSEAVEKRLIYFRTVSISFGASQETSVWYCIGFQATVDGKNIKHIMRISPSQEIIFE